MNKNTFTAVKPAKGEMNVYDFGTVKLHAYKTNDFIDNEVFIVEKNGKAVIIESPCFFDNISELEEYLKDTEVCGMLIAYHGAGASFLPGVPRYATKNAVEYSENGGGKALINNFTAAFGQAYIYNGGGQISSKRAGMRQAADTAIFSAAIRDCTYFSLNWA